MTNFHKIYCLISEILRMEKADKKLFCPVSTFIQQEATKCTNFHDFCIFPKFNFPGLESKNRIPWLFQAEETLFVFCQFVACNMYVWIISVPSAQYEHKPHGSKRSSI